MSLDAELSLEDALDLCWTTMAECFIPEETLLKQSMLEKYWPDQEQLGLKTLKQLRRKYHGQGSSQ